MRQAIAHHFPPTVKVSQPDGGYFLWLELDPALSSMELYRRALSGDQHRAGAHVHDR